MTRALVRHFWSALFDFGVLTQAGADAFTRVLLGATGIFYAVALLLLRIYVRRYAVLSALPTAEGYRRAVFADDLLLLAAPMVLCALLALILSHALFPDERDLRILGPLPLPRSTLFLSKAAAFALFIGLVAVAAHLTLLPLVIVTGASPWRAQPLGARLLAWTAASAAASTFAIFVVAAVVGGLMLAVAPGHVRRVVTILKAAALAVLAACVPLLPWLSVAGAARSETPAVLAWLPPAWFLGLERVLAGQRQTPFPQLAQMAGVAWMTAAGLALASAIGMYRRLDRLLVHAAGASRWPAWRTHRTRRSPASPAFLAVRAFTAITLRRSPLHQGVLIGLSACGVGIAVRASGSLWLPFMFIFACGIAMRTAFALPLDLRANWIFRMFEEDETRADQLRAVDVVATGWIAALPAATAVPALWHVPRSGALSAWLVVAATGVCFAGVVLRDWRQVPFTCSYMPGKRFVGTTVVLGLVSCLLFALCGTALTQAAVRRPALGLVFAAGLLLAAWLVRRRRRTLWRELPLVFEDELPDAPRPIDL